MPFFTKFIVYVAMSILTAVSIVTTYLSLEQSILPTPVIPIRLWDNTVWNCSVLALGLSLAIGMLLYALKVSIIDGQKRLNILGILGMTLVAFVSIVFNIDILYRTADREFFMEYTTDRVKAQYADYLSEVQGVLTEKRTTIRRGVATQEGELEAEVKGLRRAPEGYGTMAKQEDYELTLKKREAEIDIEPIEAALAAKAQADTLLASSNPTTIDEVYQLQNQLRVAAKDLGSVAGIPLPPPVKLDNPLFAVFEKLADWRSIGIKEVILLIIAFLIDLGDIVGYVLIPNKKKEKSESNEYPAALRAYPDLPGPKPIEATNPVLADIHQDQLSDRRDETSDDSAVTVLPPDSEHYEPRSKRPLRFGKR